MNIAVVAHLPIFLPGQRAAFARYAPHADYTVVVPRGLSRLMRPYCESAELAYEEAPHGSYLAIVDWLAQKAQVPTLIVEWDVVPIRPVVFSAACSYRGKQHANMPTPPRRFYYPNILAFNPAVDQYTPRYLSASAEPFSTPFRALEHRIIEAAHPGLPDCCAAAGFSLIGDEYAHHLHGAMQTPERAACWAAVLYEIGAGRHQILPPNKFDVETTPAPAQQVKFTDIRTVYICDN